jgi:hypothetical protein
MRYSCPVSDVSVVVVVVTLSMRELNRSVSQQFEQGRTHG